MSTPYHLHANLPIHPRFTTLLAYMAQNYPAIAYQYNALKADDWEIVVKDTDRGFCKQSTKLIVIPEWAFSHESNEFPIYYLAHELAHVNTCMDNPEAPHGKEWRTVFMSLCPKHLVKYDLNYRLGDTDVTHRY